VRDAAIAAAIFVVTAATVHAQAWPTRPIRLISPFPAGSASDTTARVVVDQANPDGYTLVTSSSSMANGKVLHSKLPYDVLHDFTPVAMFGEQPNVLVASKQSGFKTVGDLIAAAKAKPGTLTFASAGVGSTSHTAGERFRLAAKIDVRHIPFRENGLTEVMAGRIDY